MLKLRTCNLLFDWGEPEQAPHYWVAHIRFVIDSVQQKLLTNTRNKPYNDNNMMSMQCIFGAINHDTESAMVLSTIKR